MKQHYIYQTTNLINAKQYIGYHFGEQDDNYLGSGVAIIAAVKKYGRENFHKDILYVGEDALKMERGFIKTIVPEYNIHEGGGGGDATKYMSPERRAEVNKHNSETQRKLWTDEMKEQRRQYLKNIWTDEMRAERSEKMKNLWTDEMRAERSEKMKGRKLSEEHKQNIRAALKGKNKRPRTQAEKDNLSAIFKGKKPSLEARKKMSEAQKRIWTDPEIRAQRIASMRKKS